MAGGYSALPAGAVLRRERSLAVALRKECRRYCVKLRAAGEEKAPRERGV